MNRDARKDAPTTTTSKGEPMALAGQLIGAAQKALKNVGDQLPKLTPAEREQVLEAVHDAGDELFDRARPAKKKPAGRQPAGKAPEGKPDDKTKK